MIFISKTTADSNGHLRIRNYQLTAPYENTARISRDKTLDGGGVLSHYGVSEIDRSLVAECRLSDTDIAIIRSLFENASQIRVSYWDGAYIGYIYGLKAARDGVSRITIYFSEKFF
ncbi:hypothetical protein DSCW_08840 [Desulfosarcina widdelii]|uniref:Phage tail protein n=1 Tax=Desulfosarcina widdelii TaxID=947919 RepID=A0A5K7ZAH4_9BACT|nr:hypothetical protein [Desulfosarcina widdelii]BBO73467.1 hypothetical protein DSCW_08840 [Desulfosarcina widdelii]